MKSIANFARPCLLILLTMLLTTSLAQAEPKTHTLTVAKSGSGSGTVISSPAGINCGSICSAGFKAKARVVVTATPSAGSVFQGWTGACGSTVSTCTVIMKQATSVTANFAAIRVTLGVTQTGEGTGTVASTPSGIDCGTSCSADFNQYSEVKLTATPALGSTFTGWSGACTGTATSCAVAMTQAQTVNAGFAFIKMALNVTKTGSGAGTITSSPAGIDCGAVCSAQFSQNTLVTLTATPATGSTFQGWSGGCTGAANTCTVILNQAQALSAEFSPSPIFTYQYDPNGNPTQTSDPLDNIRQIQYDSLDQAIRVLEPHPGAPGSTLGQIDTDYDPLGQMTRITDPRNLETGYERDALGNLMSQTSPDTGVSTFIHDNAGNLKTRTDARGNTATYSYDSQNRPTQTVYGDQTINYLWDSCANGIGRLCSLANNDSSLSYSYDSHGRITGKSQTGGGVTLNTSYSYNTVGQWEQTVTPAGHTLGYVWLNGRIDAVTVNGQPLIGQIDYEPDGQIGGWVWGNNTASQRLYDLSGRPVLIDVGLDAQSQLPEALNYSYDAAGRITDLTHAIDASSDQHHDYDGLDRLIASTQGLPIQNSYNYTYDLSGNRTAAQHNTTADTYNIDPGSNRLQSLSGSTSKSYSHDAAGHLTGNGTLTYGYNAEGRRISATATNFNASYAYNALGQRVTKTVNGVTTRYFYDEQGHLLGEYNTSGQPIHEIVWFGHLPIAVLKPAAPLATGIELFYLHADNLGTPRKISRPSDNQVMWTWEGEAFGNTLPNQNPSGQGDFVFNLRFPGQYYDQKTGLHYNYFRDYDPTTGRYSQSDPIGLKGGINTYSYVAGNPVNAVDPLGLTTIFYHQGSQMMSIYPEQPGKGAYFIPASSGRPNCGCDETSKNNGPIPRGDYNLNTSDISNPPWYKDIFRNTRGDWGDWRVSLFPIPGTNTFGRSGFFLHGGSLPGSAGCIDFGGGLFGNSTSDQLLNDILNDPDGVIPVFVR